MRLSEWRDKFGVSRKQVADSVGASKQAVLNWERMSRHPEPAYISRIVTLTDGQVTANDFLEHWREVNKEEAAANT